MSSIMDLTSSAIRGVIIAPPDKKLVIADLSNIEGRKLAWLAGENWKLDAFAKYDATTDKKEKWALDVYNMSYAKVFRKQSSDVTKSERSVGKVLELAFGYQGGIGACITFALAYGINLEEMAEGLYNHLPSYIVAEAENFLVWQREQGRGQYGLSDKAFVTWDSIKRMWRNAHVNTQNYWQQLESACVAAVLNPGSRQTAKRHIIKCNGAWLRISLPSGRCLCYPMPKVEDGKLSYMGLNQYTRKWERLNTYGGKLVENATQASARDILAANMLAIDDAGYKIVLTVHDEIIAETLDSEEFNVNGLVKMMSTTPEWAEGLPLSAEGFECRRYRKD